MNNGDSYMFLSRSRTLLKAIAYIGLILSLYSITASTLGLKFSAAPYSILNNGEKGLSSVRVILEKKLGLKTTILTSSLKSLSRVDKDAILVIMAPTLPYSYEEVVALLEFLLTKNASLLIVDDFGKANSLLQEIWFLFSLQQILGGGEKDVIFKGLYFNTSAVVADAASYWRYPTNPIIKSFLDSYGITRNVHKILTIFPSSLSIYLEVKGKDVFLPLPQGLLQTTPYSWLETNISLALKGQLSPDPWEWGGIPFALGLAIEFGQVRLAFISDPDIFTNGVLSICKKEGFDNEIFIENLFNWLSRNRRIKLVIFDEAHLSRMPYDPLFGLSLWLKVLTEASSSWYLAPVLPLIMFSIITSYLPREKGMGGILLSRVERVVEESPFKRKIKWLLMRRDYRSALSIMIHYLLQAIKRKYNIRGEDLEQVLENLINVRYDLVKYSDKLRAFALNVKMILEKRKKIKKLQEFESIVREFNEIKDILELT